MAIRILLGDLSIEMRARIEEAVRDQPDIAILATGTTDIDVLLRAGEAGIQVAILAGRREDVPALAERLVDEYPEIRVIIVDPANDSGTSYKLHPHLVNLGKITTDTIVDVIRRLASE